MAVLLARYRVNDYGTYTAQFQAFEYVRRELGSTGHRVMRAPDQTSVVVVLIEFATLAAARAFRDDPRRMDVLERAGVVEHDDLVLEDMESMAY